MFRALVLCGVALLALIGAGSPSPTPSPAQFQINTRQIVRQVLPRDAIPALFLPKYDNVRDASYMRDEDRVIAVQFAGKSLAYPTRILDFHEIVNDLVDGRPLLVTY